MPHWHDHNPWATRLRYISFDDLVALYGAEKTVRVVEKTHGKIDAYLLKQPDGSYEFGIRYGKEGQEYLSPSCEQRTADMIWRKYND